LKTICSLQYSNKTVINKASQFSLNLTFAVEHNLKQQYLRWLVKHLLCQTHTLNKATMAAMEIASMIKVLPREALHLDKATVDMMIRPSEMGFNHHNKTHQQLQELAPDLLVFQVAQNLVLPVFPTVHLRTECRGSLLLMPVAFLNTHHLSVRA
jgi:hypothetical protein